MDPITEPWISAFDLDNFCHPISILNFISPLDGSHLPRRKSMAPPPLPSGDGEARPPGPHPSFIQVAKPFIFEQEIQECIERTGVSQTKEDSIRLQGVTWIDNVRKALKLPVRTFNTAVVYYHKFRLVHSDNEYSWVDAAAAALFTACKIEDTLKKSRDILCAAYNLKLSQSDHLSPDDAMFEQHSRSIIGLERLMLEASGFDFRNRHPQKLLIKLAKAYGVQKGSSLIKIAYCISLDLYRTFAPLKQSTPTMAFACLELSSRLLNEFDSFEVARKDYASWQTSREEIMETMLDLLELYTHHRSSTSVGPEFPLDLFLSIRIPLNQENLPRFTAWKKSKEKPPPSASSASAQTNGIKASNGTAKPSPKDSPMSPPANMAPTSVNGTRAKMGERGRDGTVRFMLDPEREREEKAIVAEYFKMEEEEYEVEEDTRRR